MPKVTVEERRLIGCLAFSEETPTFALPLFDEPVDPAKVAVQEVDEIHGTIEAFRELEGDLDTLVPVDIDVVAKVGGDPIYIVVAGEKQVIAGPLPRIRNDLAQLLRTSPVDTAFRTQLAELIGSTEEKHSARSEMRQLIASTSNEHVAYSFLQRSVLRVLLWDKLVASAPDDKAAQRILRARSDMDVKVGLGNAVTLDLGGISPNDYKGTTTGVLALELETELKAMSTVSPKSAEIIDDRHEISSVIRDAIAEIVALPRQEERIARLMGEAVDHPALARMILLEYPYDRAKFMNSALKQIRGVLNEVVHNQSSAEFGVAKLAQRLIKEVYPLEKGVFLIHLAKHVGHVPAVAQVINSVLMRSSSTFVVPYTRIIEDNLDAGRHRAKAQREARGDDKNPGHLDRGR